MIKKRIEGLINAAVSSLKSDGMLPNDAHVDIEVTIPKQKSHGDYTTNIALALSGLAGKPPRDLAQEIVGRIPCDGIDLTSTSVAGPGFINFTVSPQCYINCLKEIDSSGKDFGCVDLGHQRRVQVEFVSANPTGPLHIGHGRGAVYGDVLGNILAAAGYKVTKEYYVNDSGVQIKTLGRSLYLRYRELKGDRIEFPQECYQGHYIVDMARKLDSTHGQKLSSMAEEEAIDFCGHYAGDLILDEIKLDLAETGVVHDNYFFEHRLHDQNMVDKAISYLREKGHLYEKDGALWFRSTDAGDDKDRVLKKGDGSLTYFAADIAYHKEKYDRGFDRVIDIWGADHGGYVARMKAAIASLGHNPESFDAVLIQLVNLMRGGELVSMSTRSATYETLEDVRKEVGRDACRYFFLMRSHNAQLDFDLELAKRETADNPVYYIQYAHARIASIFRKAAEAGMQASSADQVDLAHLALPEEARLARMLMSLPEVIEECAIELEPHKLAFFLLELARMFQSYYSKGRNDDRYMVVTENRARTAAKLYLLKNVQIVIQNALRILGISAPEVMKREEVELA